MASMGLIRVSVYLFAYMNFSITETNREKILRMMYDDDVYIFFLCQQNTERQISIKKMLQQFVHVCTSKLQYLTFTSHGVQGATIIVCLIEYKSR